MKQPEVQFTVGVGSLRFGHPIPDHCIQLMHENEDLRYDNRERCFSIVFDEGGELTVTERNGIVEALSFDGRFVLNGVNLIGVSIPDVEACIGVEHDSVDSQLVLEETFLLYWFDAIGMEVWEDVRGCVMSILLLR